MNIITTREAAMTVYRGEDHEDGWIIKVTVEWEKNERGFFPVNIKAANAKTHQNFHLNDDEMAEALYITHPITGHRSYHANL